MPTSARKTTAVPQDTPAFDEQSTLAEELVASGAAPVEPDVYALLKQLQEQAQAQQEKIDRLEAERGIPSDPRQATLMALTDHLKAQQTANPQHADSYKPVLTYLDGLDSESLTPNQAQKARNLVDRLRKQHSGHELGYVDTLAEDLHTSTLDDDDE